jgi:hypothetical protein
MLVLKGLFSSPGIFNKMYSFQLWFAFGGLGHVININS